MAFIKTVEYGSFTKAAEILNYSQSGISRMIHDLEKACQKSERKLKKGVTAKSYQHLLWKSMKIGLTSVDNSEGKNNIFYNFHKIALIGWSNRIESISVFNYPVNSNYIFIKYAPKFVIISEHIIYIGKTFCNYESNYFLEETI